MSMADYEFGSGYNLPPGCFGEDLEGNERSYCPICESRVVMTND